MAVKTITITTEAYERLAMHKGPKDSFTDVILRTYKPSKERSPLWDLVGILTPEQGAELKRNIEEMRETRIEQARTKYSQMYPEK